MISKFLQQLHGKRIAIPNKEYVDSDGSIYVGQKDRGLKKTIPISIREEINNSISSVQVSSPGGVITETDPIYLSQKAALLAFAAAH